MPDDERPAALARLFAEAGGAHHRAFADSDGDDPEWPMWYAAYLLEPLRETLEADFTQSELIYLIVSAENERVWRAPGAPWDDYYARYFTERYL
jgi:hypothetical protein